MCSGSLFRWALIVLGIVLFSCCRFQVRARDAKKLNAKDCPVTNKFDFPEVGALALSLEHCARDNTLSSSVCGLVSLSVQRLLSSHVRPRVSLYPDICTCVQVMNAGEERSDFYIRLVTGTFSMVRFASVSPWRFP